MTAQDILAWRDRKPFQPFRVYLDDGAFYDIVRPRMAIIADFRLVVAIPNPTDPESDIFDHFERARYEYITRVEPLTSSATA